MIPEDRKRMERGEALAVKFLWVRMKKRMRGRRVKGLRRQRRTTNTSHTMPSQSDPLHLLENDWAGILFSYYSYGKDVQSMEHRWASDENRPRLRLALLKTQVFRFGSVCGKCGNNPATSKCITCNAGLACCEPCMLDDHTNIANHKLMTLFEGKEQLGLLEMTRKPRLVSTHVSHCVRPVKDIDLFLVGMQSTHMTQIATCDCQTLAEHLVELGFWPLNPSTTHVAFSIETLKHYRLLNLHGALSINAFVKALKGI